MWERLKIAERDRWLGLLFLTVALATAGGAILSDRFPNAGVAWFALPAVVGLLWLARGLVVALRRPGRAPVGPLSRDEINKARSKLGKQHQPRPLKS
jgi:hypothetical protein